MEEIKMNANINVETVTAPAPTIQETKKPRDCRVRMLIMCILILLSYTVLPIVSLGENMGEIGLSATETMRFASIAETLTDKLKDYTEDVSEKEEVVASKEVKKVIDNVDDKLEDVKETLSIVTGIMAMLALLFFVMVFAAAKNKALLYFLCNFVFLAVCIGIIVIIYLVGGEEDNLGYGLIAALVLHAANCVLHFVKPKK